MDWFNQFIVFAMSGGFWHWVGCWFLLVPPLAVVAAIIGGTIERLIPKRS